MLRSRIHRQVRFSAMDLATVLEVIPRYHPVYADTPAKVIADIDMSFSATYPAVRGSSRNSNSNSNSSPRRRRRRPRRRIRRRRAAARSA